MPIIDTHAHLDHLENLDEALKNAADADVASVVAVSIDLKSCQRNIEIKEKYSKPDIYVALGMHPSDADKNQIEEILKMILKHKDGLVAVGEIGLDFWYKWVRKDQDKKNEQRLVFRKQLELAKELNLPVIVHTRGTWKEAFEVVKEVGIERAEFHWYSGPVDVLKEILNQGYLISTAPSIAYSSQSREAIAFAPIEQTLIETDSPVFFRNRETDDPGFQAEPKDVWRTLKAYCELKKLDENDALQVLNANARKFFRIN